MAHPYPTSHSQLNGPSVSYVSLSTQRPIRLLRLTLNSDGPSVSYVSLSTQWPIRLLRLTLNSASPTDGPSELNEPILRLTLNSVAHPSPTSHSQLSGPSVSYVSLSTQSGPSVYYVSLSTQLSPVALRIHSPTWAQLRVSYGWAHSVAHPYFLLRMSHVSTQRPIRLLRLTLR